MKYLLFFLSSLSLLMISCSSEEEPEMMIIEPEPEVVNPDVIGIYKLSSARDECPDPELNTVNQGTNGRICASAGCATITFTLREDSTYNYNALFAPSGGTPDEYIEDGIFTYGNDIIVTTSLDQEVIDTFIVVSDGKSLDFLNFTDDNGCKQYWRFSK